jgi:formylglycine-generating enzyme required for sulfatase activity
MPQIFISYRRSDIPYVPQLLRDRLVDHFGRGTVFMDIDNIPFGVDFVDHLDLRLRSCDLLLAIIGDGWLGASFADGPHAGTRRLDEPSDFVRQEIGFALARGIPVIPVLIGRAEMPEAADLPTDLQALARRNAAEVRSGRDFLAHVERLVRGIEFVLTRLPPGEADRREDDGSPPQADVGSPEEVRERQLRWATHHSIPTELVNAMGMRFVWIPPGRFRMGSPPEEAGRRNTEALHPVTLTSGYYLGVTPVTQAQWQSIMGAYEGRFRGNDHPAEACSWDRANELCARLQRTDGRPYRLPTEAEWEYACRAGTSTPYHSGTEEQSLAAAGWYSGNSRGATQPVGQLLPNAWGVFDMHGNVWEWCWDWYVEHPEGGAGPRGPARGEARVLRGGSWKDPPRHCRSARRLSYAPDYQDDTIGCRVCFSLEKAGAQNAHPWG